MWTLHVDHGRTADTGPEAPSTLRRRSRLSLVLPLVLAAAMMGLGTWFRWPTVAYQGPPDENSFNTFAVSRLIYSDIGSLFFRDGLSERPRPYFDYPLEYPVGMGFAIYMLNAGQTLRGYFLATSLFLVACGFATMFLLSEFPRSRPLLLALSPALAFYVNLNWDLWGIVLMVAALLLFVRGHNGLSAAVMAAAVWTKFFPILLIPLMILDRAHARRWKDVGAIAGSFALVSIVVNAPVLLLRPQAWLYFFEFSQSRGPSLNLWTFFHRWHFTTEQINVGSAALLLTGMAIIAWRQWQSDPKAFLPLCCAAISWFIFINKAYSPQYDLWIVVLLAIAGAAPAIAITWSAADLITFGATFLFGGLIQFPGANEWFTHFALLPATALREGVLLLVVVYCLLPHNRRDTATTAGISQHADS